MVTSSTQGQVIRKRHSKRRLGAWHGNGHDVTPRLDHPLMDYLGHYLEWRRVTGASEATVKSIDHNLSSFIDWCDVRGLSHPQEFTRAVLEAYQRALYLRRKRDGKPFSITSQLLRLRFLIGWCRWLSRERIIEHNAALDLVLPRKTKTLPKVVPSVEQMARLLAQPDLGEITGARDRAMLEVLYSTGMRSMELCNLTLSDVDLEHGTVWIRQGKGRRDRFIAIGARACEWVRRYLDEVRVHLVVRSDEWALFLTDYGEAYRRSRLGNLVSRYMRRAGLMEGSCHALRHACATHMLENGADIRFIQAQLGHQNLSSTQVYTYVAIGKLKAIHAATHPAHLGEALGTRAALVPEASGVVLLLEELEREGDEEAENETREAGEERQFGM
jgi:integrase/recombinase XerD